MEYIRHNGARLAFRLLNPNNPNTPLLLVQGWGRTSGEWEGVEERFARHRPVLIYDSRGLGESTTDEKDDDTSAVMTMQLLAGDAYALIEHCFPRDQWSQVHVAGVSMGGCVAQHLALEHPERVRSLILACTHSSGKVHLKHLDISAIATLLPPTIPRELISLVLQNDQMLQGLQLNPEVVHSLLSGGNGRLSWKNAQLAALITHDSRSRLPSLTIPTLVIHGTHDDIIPFSEGKKLASLLPNATFYAVEDGTHYFWQQDPNVFDKADAFLTNHDGNLQSSSSNNSPA